MRSGFTPNVSLSGPITCLITHWICLRSIPQKWRRRLAAVGKLNLRYPVFWRANLNLRALQCDAPSHLSRRMPAEHIDRQSWTQQQPPRRAVVLAHLLATLFAASFSVPSHPSLFCLPLALQLLTSSSRMRSESRGHRLESVVNALRLERRRSAR